MIRWCVAILASMIFFAIRYSLICLLLQGILTNQRIEWYSVHMLFGVRLQNIH
jgi:hypothetical protein